MRSGIFIVCHGHRIDVSRYLLRQHRICWVISPRNAPEWQANRRSPHRSRSGYDGTALFCGPNSNGVAKVGIINIVIRSQEVGLLLSVTVISDIFKQLCVAGCMSEYKQRMGIRSISVCLRKA